MSNQVIDIGVKDGACPAAVYEEELFAMGFFWLDNMYYMREATPQMRMKVHKFCSERQLKYFTANEYGERSSDYRKTYFAHNKPDRKGRYRCVYCGRKYKKEKITIDHLYPVSRVSQNPRLQKKMKRKGILSLNAPENLVAACASCNRFKSAKMGKWITKARLGRHAWYWALRKVLWAFLAVVSLYCVTWFILSNFFPSAWRTVLHFLPFSPLS